MLTSTYIHIPGIGKGTERKIWSGGITTWNEFLQNKSSINLPGSKKDKIALEIENSIEKLEIRDIPYFAKSIPISEHWRGFRNFSDSVAYVDIETTGLSPSSSKITVIGVYDGKDVKSFVRGINLEEIVQEMEQYDFLVTFNGARFDLPFIHREFPQITMEQMHTDLMYPLRRIGLKGGLKNIEHMLGINRSEETEGMDGFEAVRLWKEYEKGNEKALDLLLEYNREDIVNLETILEITYDRFIEHCFQECTPQK
ncbi:ribonuclease H-like domain-containing protein [Methanohalophilus profundi]|uniref:ribonuclease H-like domain-containing protein n=1 Tax=Methanohalophilus profundi TaxID=2138083 RepID=UPI00101D6B24|nr:ribonuclease H-like domain-containing protein [Methanohalophilus profundi]